MGNRLKSDPTPDPQKKCEDLLTKTVDLYLNSSHDAFLKQVPTTLRTFKNELGDKHFSTLEARIICARLIYLSQPSPTSIGKAIRSLEETVDYLSKIDVSPDEHGERLTKWSELKVLSNSLLHKCLLDEDETYQCGELKSVLTPVGLFHSVHTLLANDLTMGYIAFRQHDYLNAYAFLHQAIMNRETIGWDSPNGKKGMEYCRACLDLIELTSADLILAEICFRFNELDKAEFFGSNAMIHRQTIFSEAHFDLLMIDNLLRMIRSQKRASESN